MARREVIQKAMAKYRATERDRLFAWLDDALEREGMRFLDGDEREEAALALACGCLPYDAPSAPAGPAGPDDDVLTVGEILKQHGVCERCEG